jgi:hypothetical protein
MISITIIIYIFALKIIVFNHHVHNIKYSSHWSIYLPKHRSHLHPHPLAFRSASIDLDHYQGITHSWNYGPIYASNITRKLLLTKYPELREKVHVIPYGEWHQITINESKMRVMAVDSNHMAGSIMVMINYR